MKHAARFVLAAAILFTFVMALLPHPPSLPGTPSDKVLHVLAFAVLAILAVRAFPVQSLTTLLCWLVGFGALIELLQAIPALHRDSDPIDLAFDAAAALLAGWTTRRLTVARRD